MHARGRFALVPLVALAACRAPTPPPAPPSNAAAQTTAAADATVVLQLAYRETFAIGPPFTRVPPFTLLSDGTLITAGDGPAPLTSRLSLAEMQRIIDHVRGLGLERLESYTDSCKPHGNNGSKVCLSDARYTILRSAFGGGATREVVTYGGFSNAPDTMAQVVDYLEQFPHRGGAHYVPTRAAIHVAVRDRTDPRPADCPAVALVDLHRPPGWPHGRWGLVVEGPALARVLALGEGRPNPYHFEVCTPTDLYQVVVMPGVPGSDLDHELRGYADAR